MSSAARRWTCGLLCLAGGGDVALAQGPSWTFAEYGHVSTRLQADETGEGQSGQLVLPLSQSWFFSAAAGEIDARFENPSIPITERFTHMSGGLGLHSTGTKTHMFALLSYVTVTERDHFTDGSFPDRRERHEGAIFAMGARGLLKPYLSLEPELGLGELNGLEGFVRIKLALRLIPRVWLVGGLSSGLFFADDYTWLAGLRLSWSDATPRRRRAPGTKILNQSDPTLINESRFATGTSLTALRLLRLQQKPLAGAAEILDVPAGATLVLQESMQNDFGIWWRVVTDGHSGWIRERELK